jgi:hypothetical protein
MDAKLEEAKWKRAGELVVEAGDMNPGDAAIMFLIAAVQAQRTYYDDIILRTLNGEDIPGLKEEQEIEVFRIIRTVLGEAKYAEARDGFLKSPLYRTHYNQAVRNGLTFTLNRLVLAVELNETLRPKDRNL